jgi:AraC-like DNA-binding protein
MKKEDFNLTLLNAARKRHNADWNWKDINSPFARLYMVESGSAKVILPDGVHIIQPGYLYLIPAFVTHSYESDNVFIHYYFHIYNEYDIFDRFDFPFEVDAGELDVLLVKRLLAINPEIELKYSDPKTYDNFSTLAKNIAQNSQKSFISGLETTGILKQLFSRFLNKATYKQEITDKRIKKALRYIRENIDKNLYINDLAEICGLNHDHFTRIFKKEMQCTPMQYIIRKKIEKAQLLILVASENSIKDIAYSLSFDNDTHFHRSFKKVTGVSPIDYKNQYK